MNNRKWYRAAKYAAYAALMLFLYVLQTTPRLFSILGVRPNLVIPAAVGIAVLEGAFAGGVYGALAGILCDLAGSALFGFSAVILMPACVAAGLLVTYLLRPGMINYVLLLAGVLLTRGLLDFLLNYVMWGYDSVWMVFVYGTLPGIIYSAAVSPLVYYLLAVIRGQLEARMEI